jgi:hypothetical protein
MQKTLLASLIVVALSACNSESDLTATPGGATGQQADDQTTVVVPGTEGSDASGADSGNSGAGTGDDKGDEKTDTDFSGDNMVEDDKGIDDDAGSATSDGGQISDDAGSSSSDGGQISDDAGSSSSDGGQGDDGGDTPDDSDNTNTTTSNGGSFQSDSVGGDIIYQSTLSSGNSETICTTLSEQNNFSNIYVGDFILHNNAWRPWRAFEGYEWEQCIYTGTNGALAGWNYDWGPGRTGINGNPNASGDFYVRSYPELIYGVKDEFRTSAPPSQTGFPVRFGDMPNISIDYSYDGPQYGEERVVNASNNPRFPNGTLISGERNVAIESFFYNADENGQCSEDIVTRTGGSNHTYEVMVWLDAGAERLPAGPGNFVTNLDIRGDAYKVYTKASDPRYVAFVAQNPTNSGTIYWNDFTDWAKTYAYRVKEKFGAQSNSEPMDDDWCIANIIVGTEIFWGAGNLDIYDWTITQRR